MPYVCSWILTEQHPNFADSFHVKHKGNKHLACSDSQTTSETYLQFLEMHYKEILKPELLNLVFEYNHLTFLVN